MLINFLKPTIAKILLFLFLMVGISGFIIWDRIFTAPSVVPSNFNLLFKYGVVAGNELDTFQGTYKADMVQDKAVIIKMILTKEELNRIYQKMREIGFFDYPDKFIVNVKLGELVGSQTPHPSYYFKVQYGLRVKELQWDDEILAPNKKAEALRELIQEIESIIQSKPEYKTLPPPKGGYL